MLFSYNRKLQTALSRIERSLRQMGIREVRRYYNEFRREPDYNIAAYGNLLIYYWEVRDFYRRCGYTSLSRWSDQRIWDLYRRQVGYVVRKMLLGR